MSKIRWARRMRLWSLHPRYLDTKGLVALWREALLAQAVLYGETRGYTRHPQLYRFLRHENPRGAIAAYLRGVQTEAKSRGYQFDAARIRGAEPVNSISVTRGQITFEWQHLLEKLMTRDPDQYQKLLRIQRPRAFPFFYIIPGDIASWERPGKTKDQT